MPIAKQERFIDFDQSLLGRIESAISEAVSSHKDYEFILGMEEVHRIVQEFLNECNDSF